MIKFFEKNLDNIKHSLKTLQNIYKEIPNTICTCSEIGICCAVTERDIDNVANIYPVEYLNILHYLAKRIKDLKSYLIRLKTLGFLNIAMENMYRRKRKGFKKDAKRQICIFRDDKKKTCRIYQARPFDCRLYGIRQTVIANGKILQPPDCNGVKIFKKNRVRDWDKEKIKILYNRVKAISDGLNTKELNPVYPLIHTSLETYFLSDFIKID